MRIGIFIFLFFCWSCNNSKKGANINIIYPAGGYSFIDPTTDTLFSEYPLKSIMPKKDSVRIAYYGYYFLKSFKEPNLSLRPSPTQIFRLVYEDRATECIVTLTETNIQIKQWKHGIVYPERDLDRLTDAEKNLYYIFERYFPLDEKKPFPQTQHRVDSLLKVYPELASTSYYQRLLDKVTDKNIGDVTYSTDNIKICKSEFARLVNLINSAGYWSMPYEIHCNATPMDAGGFVLEANIGSKYNIVNSTHCPGDTSNYTKACQEIIKAAKLDKKVNLVWYEN